MLYIFIYFITPLTSIYGGQDCQPFQLKNKVLCCIQNKDTDTSRLGLVYETESGIGLCVHDSDFEVVHDISRGNDHQIRFPESADGL